MHTFFKALLIQIVFVGSGPAFAQVQFMSRPAGEGAWSEVISYSNVVVSWRWVRELKNQVKSELRFHSQNFVPVEVTFNAFFECRPGVTEKSVGGLFKLNPGQTKRGEAEGFIWYPCDGREAPAQGGVVDLTVKILPLNTR